MTVALPAGPDGLVTEAMRHGLADADDVIAGVLSVQDLSRRNVNGLVACGPQRMYLLKTGADPARRARLANEADVVPRLAGRRQDDGPRPATADVVPVLHAHDALRGVLVLQGVRDAVDLKVFHAEREAHPSWIGRVVGEALAHVHSAGAVAPAGAGPPWALSLHRPTVDGLRHLTPASLELIRGVQGEPSVGGALDALRETWAPQVLVHNDVKWENLLLSNASDGNPRLWIVDWEDAADGDPLWDVGSAAAAHLGGWIRTIDVTRGTGSAELPTLARIPLDETAAAVRALWNAYLTGRGLADAGGALAARTARFAGARLLMSAHEATQAGGRFGPHLVLHAQLGANLLTRPETAVASIGLTAMRG